MKMALSVEEIRRRASEQRQKTTIALACLHQNRLRFHGEVIPSTPALASWMYRGRQSVGGIAPLLAGREGVAQALTDFLAMVQNLIPKDKFETFKTLFRFPVITNEVLAVCYDKLSRIFEGRNPAYSYQFTSTEFRSIFLTSVFEFIETPFERKIGIYRDVRTHIFVGDGALDVPKSATNHEAIYKPVKRAEQAPLYVEKAIRRKHKQISLFSGRRGRRPLQYRRNVGRGCD